MKKKMLLLVVILLTLSGCTKYISDDNKKRVVYEVTGQSLPSNILCKPEDKDLLKIYEQYKDNLNVDLEDLPNCDEMKVFSTKNYSNLWVQFFVTPLAWVIIKIGSLVKSYGVSVMLVGLLIRLIMMPLTAKTMRQSQNMQKAQKELSRLEEKYRNRTDKDALMQRNQEMMQIYNKYDIKPLGSCLMSFIQIPLFLAFLEAINRIPVIFEEYLGAYQLGTTPLVALKNGNYYYIILIALIILTTYLSLSYNMKNSASSEQQSQMKYMTIFMIVFISIASFSLPTAIALYWVVTNGFSVIQNFVLSKRRSK
mgnify:FL=1